MPVECAKRILSIQSSVVSGYVGNRSATFPLQVLGYDVSCLNTVQFSTHTGYPTIRGQKLSRSEILTLFEGLVENGVARLDGFLTGYVPGASGIEAIREIARQVKQSTTSTTTPSTSTVTWVLDPVMGDEERGLYVSPDIPPLYRTLIGHADIITPNQFELEVLSQCKITTLASLRAACQVLHALGVKSIVVTTFRDPENPEFIKVIGSQSDGTAFEVQVPYYSRPYQGTGDLFAALLLAYTLRGLNLQEAVIKVLDSMKRVLERTGEVFDQHIGSLDWRLEKKEGRGAAICQACELRIVESVEDILHPKPFYHCKILT